MRELVGTNVEFTIRELALLQDKSNRVRMFFRLLLEQLVDACVRGNSVRVPLHLDQKLFSFGFGEKG